MTFTANWTEIAAAISEDDITHALDGITEENAKDYAVMIALSFLLPKLLRLQAQEAGLYRFMFIFSNVGFLGYPLAQSLFGPSAVFYVSTFVMFFQLICWSYGRNLIGGGIHSVMQVMPRIHSFVTKRLRIR